jgi:hypothetical protein
MVHHTAWYRSQEIFIVEQPLKGAFGPVADTLKTHSHRGLRTLQWNVTGDALSEVIRALDSLPYLISVHFYIKTLVPCTLALAFMDIVPDSQPKDNGTATQMARDLQSEVTKQLKRGFQVCLVLERKVRWMK